jgi:hypothetical protein
MKCHFFYLLTLALTVSPIAKAEDSASRERKIERMEDDVSALRKELADKTRARDAALKALSKAKVEFTIASAAKAKAEDALSAKPEDASAQASLEKATRSLKAAEAARDLAQLDYDLAASPVGDLKSDISRKEDSIDRLSSAKVTPSLPDCPDGNCNGAPAKAPNSKDQDKTNWQGIADIVKAVTPLGLGAMNTFLGYSAMKQASSDYRYYNANNTSLGLPSSSPNVSSYGGILASTSGLTSGLMMGSLFGQGGLAGYAGMTGGLAGYGTLGGGLMSYGMMGGGLGFGGTGYGGMGYGFTSGAYPFSSGAYTPYGGSYASPSYSNAGYSGYSGYGYTLPSTLANSSAQAAAAARLTQQQSIFASDASAAASGLQSAYSTYSSTLGSLSGTGYTGSYLPTSYLNYNYGAGSYYSPLTTTVSTGLNRY